MRAAALVLVVMATLGSACGGGSSNKASSSTTEPARSTSAQTSTTGKTYDHVVWIWMENHTYGQVIGSRSAPYATALAHQFGSATHYATVGSPSLPNYIGATSGSVQGINDDGGPQSHALTVDNLFRQVRSAGKAERSFEESMPTNCKLGAADAYAVKHNPAAYYTGADDRPACQKDDVPFTDTLPQAPLSAFSFVTPNLCHDTHDCSVAIGDAWLKNFLPPLLASADYRAGTTVIFVVWDEPTPIPNIVISPTTPAGTVATEPFDHYSLLRTTEELLGLPFLGKAATAPSMRGAFHL